MSEFLISISNSLASSYRNSGPKLVTKDLKTPMGGKEYTDSDFGMKILNVSYNLTPSELYEYSLKENNTFIICNGALSTSSGAKTGRCPNDKRIVIDESTKNIWWDKKKLPVPQQRNGQKHISYK